MTNPPARRTKPHARHRGVKHRMSKHRRRAEKIVAWITHEKKKEAEGKDDSRE